MPRLPQSQPPSVWVPIVKRWLLHLQAQGLAKTSINVRRRHVLRLLNANLKLTPDRFSVEEILAWSGTQTWATETRKSYYSSFRLFVEWLNSKDIIDATDGGRYTFPTVRQARPTPRPLPARYLKRLYASVEPRVALAAKLAGQAGLRRTEIVLVHDDDFIDDLVGTSLVVHGKGSKDRIVPLADPLLDDIEAYRQQNNIQGWLFPGLISGHLSPDWLGTLINQQLPSPWTLHCLRHRFATDIYAATQNLVLIQQLLGHESVETTQRYLAIPDFLGREAVNQIASRQPQIGKAAT